MAIKCLFFYIETVSVLVIGAGGLGCAALRHLAASGVGRIGIADYDTVESSNLPRQLLYSSDDLGRLKVDAAKERLNCLPGGAAIDIVTYETIVRGDEDFIADYGVVIDAVDRADVKLALHDSLVARRIPFVHAAASGWEGQGLTIDGAGCLRCVFGASTVGDPPDCQRAGIIGPVVGLVGHLAADDALRIVSGNIPRWRRALWKLNALESRSKLIPFLPDPNCPIGCSHD